MGALRLATLAQGIRLGRVAGLRAQVPVAPALEEIVVALDPAVSGTADAHETGIIVAGRDSRGHVYMLDERSVRSSPDEWARRAVTAYHTHAAHQIVAEGNQVGELVRLTLQTVDETAPIEIVHASHGKKTRAEPVAALCEQGRVHHVGTFGALEDQLASGMPPQARSRRIGSMRWSGRLRNWSLTMSRCD